MGSRQSKSLPRDYSTVRAQSFVSSNDVMSFSVSTFVRRVLRWEELSDVFVRSLRHKLIQADNALATVLPVNALLKFLMHHEYFPRNLLPIAHYSPSLSDCRVPRF